MFEWCLKWCCLTHCSTLRKADNFFIWRHYNFDVSHPPSLPATLPPRYIPGGDVNSSSSRNRNGSQRQSYWTRAGLLSKGYTAGRRLSSWWLSTWRVCTAHTLSSSLARTLPTSPHPKWRRNKLSCNIDRASRCDAMRPGINVCSFFLLYVVGVFVERRGNSQRFTVQCFLGLSWGVDSYTQVLATSTMYPMCWAGDWKCAANSIEPWKNTKVKKNHHARAKQVTKSWPGGGKWCGLQLCVATKHGRFSGKENGRVSIRWRVSFSFLYIVFLWDSLRKKERKKERKRLASPYVSFGGILVGENENIWSSHHPAIPAS